MKHSLKTIFLAAACVAGLGLPSVATAGVIPLDTFVTGSGFGSTAPTGTVNITDLGNDVRFDFEISDGDISALFFNLIQPFDIADVSLSDVSTRPGSPSASLLSNPSAPSGLSFDLGVDFGRGSSPGNLVRSGSFTLALEGVDLSDRDFFQTSTNSAGTPVTIGAKIQSLGAGGGGSATIGGNPSSSGGSSGGTPVPAPPALALFIPAVAALFMRRRRREA